MTTTERPRVQDALTSLLCADLSKMPAPRHIRREGQKARTAAIRALFKTLGIKGISVTMTRGSMCYWTRVALPEGIACERDHNRLGLSASESYWERKECPACARREAAERRVHHIILTAFPDLDDRSESQSDYFDFVYTLR